MSHWPTSQPSARPERGRGNCRNGEASQRELCDEADLDRSTIAELVMRMEREGLIARRRDTKDARRNTVTLTDAGRSERARLRPLVDQVQNAMAASMSTKERRALRVGLRALLAQPDSGT